MSVRSGHLAARTRSIADGGHRNALLSLLCAGVLLLCLPPPILGEENRPLRTDEALERLDEALVDDTRLSPETKKALQALVDALQAERAAPHAEAKVGPQKAAQQEALERLHLSGDMRLRHESSFSLDDQKDRHRERLRLRAGFTYDVTDEIVIGARARTGDPGDPNSPYVDLGDGFDSFDVALDSAFLTYQPRWTGGRGWGSAGKFVQPLYRNPIYGELVWDADVNPEGLAFRYEALDESDAGKLSFFGGEYVVLEDSQTDDVYATALQASGNARISSFAKLDLAVGYFYYTDATPDGSQALLADNAGNAVVDRDGDGVADDFLSDFGIVNPIAAVTMNGPVIPLQLQLQVAGEYINNLRARGPKDQGWAAGAAVDSGRWRLSYQWQVVEQDAVFSAFAQDDFLLQTNFRGHVFGTKIRFLDHFDLHLWALVSARDGTSPGTATDSDRDQWRVRSDLSVAF